MVNIKQITVLTEVSVRLFSRRRNRTQYQLLHISSPVFPQTKRIPFPCGLTNKRDRARQKRAVKKAQDKRALVQKSATLMGARQKSVGQKGASQEESSAEERWIKLN